MKKIYLALGVLVLVVLLTGAYKKIGISNLFPKTISQDEAKAKTLDFVKNNLVKPGTDVSVKSIAEENGLYKIVFTVGTQDITSYLSKDGTKFFPEAMDVTPADKQAASASSAPAPAQKDISKSDTPTVQLFVMSYCPYGTQMEKGILPVLNALKDKIKFNLEFVSYSMHNDLATNDRKELDENMRQYCIEKNQPDKLDGYLKCFLKSQEPGQETSCMASSGVNANTISSCVTATDSQFNVTKDFQDKSSYQGSFPIFEVNKDDNAKYNVQGSPTLIVNGVEASAGRDSATLLKTICGAFNNPPAECSAQLSSVAPAPGFGDGTAASSSPASCATPPAGN